MSLPVTYTVRDGCRDCTHVYEEEQWEGDPALYCCVIPPKRPLCTGGAHPEEPLRCVDDLGVYNEAQLAWQLWAKDRLVDGGGHCLLWKRKDVRDD